MMSDRRLQSKLFKFEECFIDAQALQFEEFWSTKHTRNHKEHEEFQKNIVCGS